MLTRIQVGQTAEIRSESLPDTVITASVSRISPFIEPGSFSAEVQIDVKNEGGELLPGMFVTVDIAYGESQTATLIPKSALYEDPRTGALGVFTMPSVGLEVTIAEPAAEGEPPAPMTPPTLAEFSRVEVLASGRHVVGVSGLEPGTWVVVVGQHLLTGQRTEGGPRARVRPVSWEKLLALQGLQREDYLRQFMEKQQRYARARLEASEAVAESARAAADARAGS
jgi:multidrug efflux pump subunit AcrA (membrane-fusion protein)